MWGHQCLIHLGKVCLPSVKTYIKKLLSQTFTLFTEKNAHLNFFYSNTKMLSKKIEDFFAQVSTFPLNIEIGILQIGHQADFINDCVYLQLAQ